MKSLGEQLNDILSDPALWERAEKAGFLDYEPTAGGAYLLPLDALARMEWRREQEERRQAEEPEKTAIPLNGNGAHMNGAQPAPTEEDEKTAPARA